MRSKHGVAESGGEIFSDAGVWNLYKAIDQATRVAIGIPVANALNALTEAEGHRMEFSFLEQRFQTAVYNSNVGVVATVDRGPITLYGEKSQPRFTLHALLNIVTADRDASIDVRLEYQHDQDTVYTLTGVSMAHIRDDNLHIQFGRDPDELRYFSEERVLVEQQPNVQHLVTTLCGLTQGRIIDPNQVVYGDRTVEELLQEHLHTDIIPYNGRLYQVVQRTADDTEMQLKKIKIDVALPVAREALKGHLLQRGDLVRILAKKLGIIKEG